jgi:hypothetical protein
MSKKPNILAVNSQTITCEQWDLMRRWRRTPPGFDSMRLNHLANIVENATAWPPSVVEEARRQLAVAWNVRRMDG